VTARTNLKVVHEVGLHARPASLFVKTASSFQSDIEISNVTGGKGPVDAKSVLLVLTLGVEQDCEIEITANGPDEQEAIAALTELIQSNFDEG
jgi:phosphotransferase system HPr (HPr) family protein